MRRFFVEPNYIDIKNRTIIIDEKETITHIARVLRLESGEKVEIADGDGRLFLAKIDGIEKYEITLVILEELINDLNSKVKITLFQGLPKGEKVDMIIQKATELGVDCICFVETQRSIAKINDEKTKKSKVDRWWKISRDASKQSKRLKMPTIFDPISFNNMIEMIKDYDLFLVPYECEEDRGLKQVLTSDMLNQDNPIKIGIFIGPEGGISEEEISKIKNISQIITLGKRILRTETAGLALISILQYEFGEM